MGLSVRGYSEAHRVAYNPGTGLLREEEFDRAYDAGFRRVFAYQEFAHVLEGMENVTDEAWGSTEVVSAGWWQVGGDTDYVDFPYTGYFFYRQALIDALWQEPHPQFGSAMADLMVKRKDEPFWEFIWFADNEGAISPAVAAKLAQDFRDHPEPEGLTDWQLRKHAELAKVYALAANTGLVLFL